MNGASIPMTNAKTLLGVLVLFSFGCGSPFDGRWRGSASGVISDGTATVINVSTLITMDLTQDGGMVSGKWFSVDGRRGKIFGIVDGIAIRHLRLTRYLPAPCAGIIEGAAVLQGSDFLLGSLTGISCGKRVTIPIRVMQTPEFVSGGD